MAKYWYGRGEVYLKTFTIMSISTENLGGAQLFALSSV
jgi:hypothetical protein